MNIEHLSKQINIDEDYCPHCQDDIRTYFLYHDKNKYRAIGSKSVDRYLLCEDNNVAVMENIIELCNGYNSIKYISENLNLTVNITMKIIRKMGVSGLLHNFNSKDNSEIKRFSFKVIDIKPKKMLEFFEGYCKVIIAIIWITFFMIAVYNIYSLFYDMNKLEMTYNGFKNLSLIGIGISFLLMMPSFMIHEIFHVIFAVRYGLKPTRISCVMYLGVFPMFYVKIPNMYSISHKKRIKILLAGFLANIYLMNIFLATYGITHMEIFMILAITQLNMIYSNITPLQLTDMYFIMSNIIKVPNLRQDFFKLLGTGKINTSKKAIIYGVVMVCMTFISAIYFVNMLLNTLSKELRSYNILISIFLTIVWVFVIKWRYKGIQ